MNDMNEKIIDAIIKKANALCPDSLALIGVYGSVAAGFILDDVDIGYDIYCTSWDMLEKDAQCEHAHLSKLFDSMTVYYKDKSTLKRLDEIRRRAAEGRCCCYVQKLGI